MTVTVDITVLIRAAVQDNASQAQLAQGLLEAASTIAIATPCLCEFVWVLLRVHLGAAQDL